MGQTTKLSGEAALINPEHRYGTFWRVWSGTGFYTVSTEEAADEDAACEHVGCLSAWCVEKVVGIAARNEPDAPWLMMVEGVLH